MLKSLHQELFKNVLQQIIAQPLLHCSVQAKMAHVIKVLYLLLFELYNYSAQH